MFSKGHTTLQVLRKLSRYEMYKLCDKIKTVFLLDFLKRNYK